MAPTAALTKAIEGTDLTVEPTDNTAEASVAPTANLALVSTPTESAAAQLSLSALLLGAVTAALLV